MRLATGGCLCGKVRYQAEGDPVDTGYCHCRMCQRESGAPVLAFAGFPIKAFRYSAGEPKVYRSSANGERRFCPECGSSLEYRDSGSPAQVFVNVGTLDDPSLAPPAKHIWTMTQVSWFVVSDDLPGHAEAG